MDELKTCFVISPIGESDSEIRKRSDQVLKHIISPAAKDCGYEPLRADQISEPGIITSQIIRPIINDPLVIADLTGRNPNVFYELAIRHAIQKPLVQIISKGEQIPFDVAATRIIFVNHQDLDSVDEAIKQIASQIRSVTKDPTRVDSPISMTIDLLTKEYENVVKEVFTRRKTKFSDVSLSIERLDLRLREIEDSIDSIRDWVWESEWKLLTSDREERDRVITDIQKELYTMRNMLDELKRKLLESE